ncbi:MAG: DUF1848 domain-containing protein [Clostridiaceae bacterium]|jgi:hypothetical protein|nr:DUF1848 domain-containing protein [Clostridiaceae bacterium]
MIVSASRRTDIPAFFADWFLQQLAAGTVTVRNPMNPAQQRQVDLTRAAVDAFVFWSKNPRPFFAALDRLDAAGYPYYFQFTLNAYPALLEPRVPALADRLDTFRQLAARIGADRMVWRYDPIVLGGELTWDWHVRQFAALCGQLADLTGACVFSFYTPYRKTVRQMARIGALQPDDDGKRDLIARLAPVARQAGIGLEACCSFVDWQDLPVRPAACIDPERLLRIAERPLSLKPDRSQRPGCRCVQAVDIGQYRTCRHGCRYCYAGCAGEIEDEEVNPDGA